MLAGTCLRETARWQKELQPFMSKTCVVRLLCLLMRFGVVYPLPCQLLMYPTPAVVCVRVPVITQFCCEHVLRKVRYTAKSRYIRLVPYIGQSFRGVLNMPELTCTSQKEALRQWAFRSFGRCGLCGLCGRYGRCGRCGRCRRGALSLFGV